MSGNGFGHGDETEAMALAQMLVALRDATRVSVALIEQ